MLDASALERSYIEDIPVEGGICFEDGLLAEVQVILLPLGYVHLHLLELLLQVNLFSFQLPPHLCVPLLQLGLLHLERLH